jgi:hypothetical protein
MVGHTALALSFALLLAAPAKAENIAKVLCANSGPVKPKYISIEKVEDVTVTETGLQAKGKALRLDQVKTENAKCRNYYLQGRNYRNDSGEDTFGVFNVFRNWNEYRIATGGPILMTCGVGSTVEFFDDRQQFLNEITPILTEPMSTPGFDGQTSGRDTVSSAECVN